MLVPPDPHPAAEAQAPSSSAFVEELEPSTLSMTAGADGFKSQAYLEGEVQVHMK